MLKALFDPFIEKSPVPVMARGMMERILNPEQIDEWFDSTAEFQYTKDLLFSSVFGIMTEVVLGTRKSVNAAYQASEEEIGVSVSALYQKLNGIEPETAAGLVRYASSQAAAIIEKTGGAAPSPLPGLRLKLLDGNCIEKSHHRIKETRSIAAGPLPGKSLVVYDPSLRLPIDVFPCEDGHAQERSLLKFVLPTVEENDLIIADCNFCVVEFTCGIDGRKGFFAIREHGNYPWQPLGKEKYVGKSCGCRVYEQSVAVTGEDGKQRRFRIGRHMDDGRVAPRKNLEDQNDILQIDDAVSVDVSFDVSFRQIGQHVPKTAQDSGCGGDGEASCNGLAEGPGQLIGRGSARLAARRQDGREKLALGGISGFCLERKNKDKQRQQKRCL